VDGGGEDLRARSRRAVSEDFEIAVVGGVSVGLPFLRVDLAAFDGRDHAAGEELVGRGDRFVDVAAGVAAKVDDQLAVAVLADVLERRRQLRRRPFFKVRDLHVRHAAVLFGAER
jgi:hypothetical protein